MFKLAEEHLTNSDEIMAKLIKLHKPCTLKEHKNHFEVLCDSIISQQLSTKAADTIAKRFQALYSKDNPFSPRAVLNTSTEDLRSVGLSRAKTAYIKDLAENYQTNLKDRDFQKLSDEEVITLLTSVKGIGRWTAEMFLIFSLNRLDILPVGDLGIKRAVTIEYQLKELVTPKQLIEIGEKWRPYRSVASWYLWRSLNNKQNT
ncbi:MAG: DNA-3-methyladenine glycosylase 2 family protein [Acidobacteria bacterium]|nr:DNA-3-methyladenine glycosylase 2 family protein [Acidobacteriota bacterium]